MNISFNPLGTDYTDEQAAEIAGLIYDTDPFIYPAMFASREEAVSIIPGMIRAGDRMFSPENLFVAQQEKHIAGIILWYRGPLEWEADIYRSCGGSSIFVEEARTQYFAAYRSVPSSTVSLINVCISQDARGKGIGGKMLDAFLRPIHDPCELYVLADNRTAIRLYQKKGFRITEEQEGFSLGEVKPLCYKMERNCLPETVL